MFKKQKDYIEGKIEELKVVPMIITASVCLTIGYILGAATTTTMFKIIKEID